MFDLLQRYVGGGARQWGRIRVARSAAVQPTNCRATGTVCWLIGFLVVCKDKPWETLK